MPLSRIGARNVATVSPSATAIEIARQMEERNVGSVVVVRQSRPVGIVTDRDLVLRVLRKGLNPAIVHAEEIMSKALVTARDDLEAIEAAERMREHRVRRLPVLDGEGALVAIVTLDDLVHHIGRTSNEISEAIESFPSPYQGG